MKKIILIITVLFSTQCFSQAKDTVKAKTPDQYYLIGELPMWQVMYKAVKEPGKVTREEEAMLLKWFDNLQKLPADTTKKNKPKNER